MNGKTILLLITLFLGGVVAVAFAVNQPSLIDVDGRGCYVELTAGTLDTEDSNILRRKYTIWDVGELLRVWPDRDPLTGDPTAPYTFYDTGIDHSQVGNNEVIYHITRYNPNTGQETGELATIADLGSSAPNCELFFPLIESDKQIDSYPAVNIQSYP